MEENKNKEQKLKEKEETKEKLNLDNIENIENNFKLENEKLKNENKELLDKYMRLNAEFINFKNRNEREKLEFFKYAESEMIKILLPFFDTFDSALKCEHKNLEECIKGFKLVYNSLFDILKKEGFESIKTENEKFNPEFHEAIGFDKNENLENDIITCEMQKGYKYKDKVLRHSMVKINKK